MNSLKINEHKHFMKKVFFPFSKLMNRVTCIGCETQISGNLNIPIGNSYLICAWIPGNLFPSSFISSN